MTDMAEQGLYLYTFILYESALRNKNKQKKKNKKKKTYSPFLNRMMKTRIALD